uniref:Envelope protein n=1 Tax=Pelusios castaneus TaxID=367368 RepID=A0A8C8R8P7_9SAUR
MSPPPRPLLIECGPSPFNGHTLKSLTYGWNGTCHLSSLPRRDRRETREGLDPRENCTPCIVTTRTENQITQTLKYHSSVPDNCLTPFTCVHNNTRYTLCGNTTCHQPQGTSFRGQVWVYGSRGGSGPDQMLLAAQRGQGLVATKTTQHGDTTSLTICFDACKAIAIAVGHNPKGKSGRTSSILGKYCFSRSEGQNPVGSLTCEAMWRCENNQTVWWSGKNHTQPNLTHVNQWPQLSPLLNLCDSTTGIQAPDSLYWICGKWAYAQLPANWTGTCTIGSIRPGFFLLPLAQGQVLGVPVYDSKGTSRSKRATSLQSACIISYYGPATWAEDGTYGYRTPIYMLNRIIRLQAVVEIITNETALALDLLAKMNSKMRTAIYQNRLALDYLLAKEGGLCGKFNLTNCCLEIDDTGEAIRKITKEMRKLAHVPVQTWKGIDTSEWFGGWFEWLGGFKSIMGIIIAFTCVCLVVIQRTTGEEVET